MHTTPTRHVDYAKPEDTQADDVQFELLITLDQLEAEYWPLGNGTKKFHRGVYLKENSERPDDVEGLVGAALDWAEQYEHVKSERPKYIEIKGRSFGAPAVFVGPVSSEGPSEPIFEEVQLRGSLNLHPPASKSWERLGSVGKFED